MAFVQSIMLPLHASSLLVYIVDQWQFSKSLHPFDFVRNLFNFLVCVLFSFSVNFKFLVQFKIFVSTIFAVVDNFFVIF